jgi:hypothetical protein
MAVTINASTSAGLVQTADTSGVLQLQTNSGTTALTIDTSQNVGIGTASPTKRLSVEASTAGITLTSTTGTNNSLLQVTNTGGSFYVGKDNSAGSDLGTAAYASVLYSSNAYPMVFATNSAERMRITDNGAVRIGIDTGIGSEKVTIHNSASAEAAFFVNSNATPYGFTIYYTGGAPNNTGSNFMAAVDTSVTRMTLRSNGGFANYQGNNVNLSDQREKTNIELASSYLDKICAIPVKTFNYIDQNMEEDGGLTLGVIAQDVQAVAPELVMESNWAGKDEPEKLRLSIYQTDLQYALMKCIQEQQTIINDLKARITALEGAA